MEYVTGQSRAALAAVRTARREGLPAWATMDAGPNVKVLTSADRAGEVDARLRELLARDVPGLRTVVARSGPGLEISRVTTEEDA